MSSVLDDGRLGEIAKILNDAGRRDLTHALLCERRDLVAIMQRAFDLVAAGIMMTTSPGTALAIRRWNECTIRFTLAVDTWKGPPANGGKKT